jgi:glycosyltransferase involved in cell wall biosynthesis
MSNIPLLSILVCHDESRKVHLSRLKISIINAINIYSKRVIDITQISDSDKVLSFPICPIKNKDQYFIEIIINDEKEITIGHKRNNLLRFASGKYVCFADDDDMVMPEFIGEVINCLIGDYDCASLKGKFYQDGIFKNHFVHSIEYNDYSSENDILVRPPNHLNIIRTEIAKKFTFPNKDYGEDTEWAMKIVESGMLKKEFKVLKPLYYYDKRTFEPQIVDNNVGLPEGLGSRFN